MREEDAIGMVVGICYRWMCKIDAKECWGAGAQRTRSVGWAKKGRNERGCERVVCCAMLVVGDLYAGALIEASRRVGPSLVGWRASDNSKV